MPRFHFHVYDGVNQHDRDGTQLRDFGVARLEAIRLAGEILKETAHRLTLGEDWHMEVTDERGLVLFRLDFQVMEAPVISGARRHDWGS